MYGLPSKQLCEFLRDRIANRSAIEIGTGHGALAHALSIPATDNRQQEPEIRAYYASIGQPTIRYGEHVEKLDAHSAHRKYRPQVIIACWVITHQFDPAHPERGGSTSGIDKPTLMAGCEEYIFIGNEKIHRHKPILSLPHERLTPSWLFSRALNGSPDFIGIWRGTSGPGRSEPSQSAPK